MLERNKLDSICFNGTDYESELKMPGNNTYKFRLTGVPPEQAIKRITIDPNRTVAEIKKSLLREYKLNPILEVQLIFKGKVLPDNLRFSKIGIHPEKDIITMMSTQGGGASEA